MLARIADSAGAIADAASTADTAAVSTAAAGACTVAAEREERMRSALLHRAQRPLGAQPHRPTNRAKSRRSSPPSTCRFQRRPRALPAEVASAAAAPAESPPIHGVA